MSDQLSLLSIEPSEGRVRKTDVQTARVGAARARVRSQRRMIAAALLRYGRVTADDMFLSDLSEHRSERGTWASRLAGLKKDGLLAHGPVVPGRNQPVISYVLTDTGLEWARQLTSERAA